MDLSTSAHPGFAGALHRVWPVRPGLYHVPVTRTHHRSTAPISARSRRALFVSRGSDQRDLVLTGRGYERQITLYGYLPCPCGRNDTTPNTRSFVPATS